MQLELRTRRLRIIARARSLRRLESLLKYMRKIHLEETNRRTPSRAQGPERLLILEWKDTHVGRSWRRIAHQESEG